MRRKRIGLLIAIALASVAFEAQAGTAAAEMFGFSPAGNVTMSGPLTFTFEEGTSISCNVSFLGTLTRSLVSTAAGTAFGSIIEARASECSGGATITPLVPSPLRVVRFLFPLGRERIVGLLFLFEEIGVLVERLLRLQQCLFGPTAPVLMGIENTEGELVTADIRFLNSPSLRLVQTLNGGMCPRTMTIAGRLRMSPAQTVTYLR
jgi:hypothetical protein